MIAYAAGVLTGIVVAVAAFYVLRHELEVYRRARGVTIDLTHRSRS